MFHVFLACVVAAQKGGIEVKNARTNNIEVKVKGKTKEGVLDVLTTGRTIPSHCFVLAQLTNSILHLGDKMSNLMMVNSMIYTFPGIRVVSEEHFESSKDIYPVNVNKYTQSSEFSQIPNDIILNMNDLVVWIDPLDATKEYSEGLTEYVTTMVCVARKGEPLIGVIHQPFASETYWATKFGMDKKLVSLASSLKPSNSSLKVVISRSHKGDVRHFVEKALSKERDKLVINEAAGSGYKTLELLKGNSDIYLHRTIIKKWDVCAPNAIIKFATKGEMTTLTGSDINYSFESDAVNKEGIFATAKPDLVKYRIQLSPSSH